VKSDHSVSQVREVEGFDRLRIESQHFNQLLVSQNQRETLTVQAPKDVLDRLTTRVQNRELLIRLEGSWPDRLRDALTTSLNRPVIKYSLGIKELKGLEAYAMLELSMDRLVTGHLEVKFGGMGSIDIRDLQSEGLAVSLNGAGRIDVGGRVSHQQIAIRGMGEYHAPQLESGTARVQVNGPGKATLWAVEKLKVDIRGPGAVYYYGNPQVSKRIVPIGVLTHMHRERTYS
jgi:hypothetical protein